MSDKQRRESERNARVSSYGVANVADFPSNSKGGQLFAQLNAELAAFEALQVTKATSISTRQRGSAGRSEVRDTLRAQLIAFSDTAEIMAPEHPEMKGRFQFPRTHRNDRTLIATARSFAEEAPPFKPLFVEYELPADFIEAMSANADALEEHMAVQVEGSGARVTANASIGQISERINDLIDRLDVIVRNKYRNDPAKLAAWESARRLERAARSKRSNGGSQTPQAPKTGES